MNKGQAVLCVTGGYLLGRFHKMRWALGLAGVAAGKRLRGATGGAVADLVKEPARRQLGQLRGDLLAAGRTAAVAAAGNRMNALSDRLQERAAAMRGEGPGEEHGRAGGRAADRERGERGERGEREDRAHREHRLERHEHRRDDRGEHREEEAREHRRHRPEHAEQPEGGGRRAERPSGEREAEIARGGSERRHGRSAEVRRESGRPRRAAEAERSGGRSGRDTSRSGAEPPRRSRG